MIDFCIHPNIYIAGRFNGLRAMLEDLWVRTHSPGDGTFYIVSGFANFNGGARFYKTFKEHTDNGGRIVAFLGGSTSQRLSSKQAVEALLECGVEVNIINRKRLLHAKCYGSVTSNGQRLVLSSGNFTGPGMSQNVEAAVMLNDTLVAQAHFSWIDLENSFLTQNWLRYQPFLNNTVAPVWQLLYDETPGVVTLDETEEVTLVVILGHADTVRINATPGTSSSLGSQYFWLSKDSFDFFPPLTIRNKKGLKGTLSTIINLRYVDLGKTREERITFEAENNLDFRLGTGLFRYTGIAGVGDIACISRIGEESYELRIFKQNTFVYNAVFPYAISFIGHQGKRYGYIDNQEFEVLTGITLEGVMHFE